MKIFTASCLLAFASASSLAHADSTFNQGQSAILRQAGCYVVDYSFVEVQSLKEGYSRDERVYDTNSDKTTYELIVPIQKSPTEIRLQHVLFLKDLKTGEVKGLMKHHAEDWSYEPAHYFEFISPGLWAAQTGLGQGRWVRKTTNLDDGLRYQCEAAWSFDTFNPEWTCSNFAPIPGRETRDMGRKDYNTLDRKSRVIVYENSWVERQDNVKTIFASPTLRVPMLKPTHSRANPTGRPLWKFGKSTSPMLKLTPRRASSMECLVLRRCTQSKKSSGIVSRPSLL